MSGSLGEGVAPYAAFGLFPIGPELATGYYKQLPKYTGKGNNLPHLHDLAWPSIRHSQYTQVAALVKVNTLVALSGRRRIGKTYMVCQIAQQEYAGTPVFYISVPHGLNGNVIPYFYARFLEVLQNFDATITKPTGTYGVGACFDLLGWLLRSGVIVIIDNFQNLSPLISRFRELIDWQRRTFTGRLICLGSHTILKKMFIDGSEPLYGRGFVHEIITPTSPLTVYKLLRQVRLDDGTYLEKRQLVFLYSCFGGLLQWYEHAHRSVQLRSIASNMDKLTEYLEIFFAGDPFYQQQLSTSESAVLEAAYAQMNYRSGEMQGYILHDANLDKVEHKVLNDLVKYQFLGIRSSLSKDAHNKGPSHHPHYYLRDAPLAMRAVLQANGALPNDFALQDATTTNNTPRISAVSEHLDYTFEEMVRDMVAESSSAKWKILRGDWREPCTKIDFVAISETDRTVIWGFNKLSAEKQDAHNLLCHVVSYFNNHLWQNDEYFSYQHVLLFISVHEDKKDRFNKFTEELNALLKLGRSDELEGLCKQKLSNHEDGGNAFSWYEHIALEDQEKNNNKNKTPATSSAAPSTPSTPTNDPSPIIATTSATTTQNQTRQPEQIDPQAYFVISACHALDLDDLINGVQLDNFVPTGKGI